MFEHSNHSISDENKLLDYLTEDIKWSKKLGILGGHYILLYDETTRTLLPSIWQSLDNNKIKEYAKIIMGDFPVYSYEFALKIKSIANKENVYNKLFLLINDHFFHSGNNPQIFNSANLNYTKLKRQYFENNEIPEIFIKIANDKGINIKDKIDKPLKSKGISGNNKYLMSETQLRRKFDRNLKKKASQNEYFKLIKKVNVKSELYFNKGEYKTCLTQNGTCGCSGEVIQLLYETYFNYYDNVMLIVPQECHNAVTSAIIPALTLLNNQNHKITKVSVISGFGDNNYNGIKSNNFNLEKFKVSD